MKSMDSKEKSYNNIVVQEGEKKLRKAYRDTPTDLRK